MDDAGDERSASRRGPSLRQAVGEVGGRTLALAGTRLELACVEVAEARERFIGLLLLIGAAAACGILALAVATFGVVAWFWDTHRFGAIVVVTLAHAIAGVLLWRRAAAVRRAAPALLGATLDALRRDAAFLRGSEQQPRA
jgi:uncharacterized membrane protein YqjE